MLVDRRFMLRGAMGSIALASVEARAAAPAPRAASSDQQVWLVGDDASPDAGNMADRLAKLVAGKQVQDSYLKGGAVEELEAKFAQLLGKEACLFLPTGTLANNVALRVLCGENPRALCQYDSHLYRDESDAVQRLSSINLVPLAQGSATPKVDELAAAFDAAEKGPYPLKVGAISLESPVRRLRGEIVPLPAVKEIAAMAAQHDARMHLDGARLLLAPPSLDIKAYAAPFDTVYVSLYKYLGAPFGAVIAGPTALVAEMRDDRHLFGGLVYQGWIPAVLALDRLETIRSDMARSYAVADELVSLLERQGKARRRISPNGTNIYLLEMTQELAKAASLRGRDHGIRIGGWNDGVLQLGVNRTILRRPAADYASLFQL